MENSRVESAYNFFTPQEVEQLPDLEWLIPGILPKPALGVLFGEPGCGKTFVALSMALAIANGSVWLGRSVRATNVLYLAAEGVYGLKTRIAAFRQQFGIVDECINFMAGSVDVRDKQQINGLIAELKEMNFVPGLVVVDTLARVTVGADENNAKDMGQAVEGLDRIKTAFNASILVIHHTTKAGNSFRGSSALSGASDVMILCSKAEADGSGGVTLKCEKMKDEVQFAPISVKLEKVDLPKGKSSLVLGEVFESLDTLGGVNDDRIIELLDTKFKEVGATSTELRKAFEDAGYGGKSTFDRTMRKLKKAEKIKTVREGNRARYFPLGVSVKPVS